ncbi:MAG: hypothetical protein KAS72_05490 [Phycisphaerales bacterium]|nr:hypothetical protein [Phycisphaerales bacterium]
MAKTIALVGHCGPDVFMLKTTAHRAVPDAEVVLINDQAVLDAQLAELSLLLVNRELDGSFPITLGIDLIRTVTGRQDGPGAILVSNFVDAQVEAEEAGAQPGFGKNTLFEDATLERIRSAMR